MGLVLALASFAVRLDDYHTTRDGWMFWFEPYPRSGVYVLGFLLAFLARSLRREDAWAEGKSGG